MRKGKELKTPRHASAAASRDDRLPHSQHMDKQFLITSLKTPMESINNLILMNR